VLYKIHDLFFFALSCFLKNIICSHGIDKNSMKYFALVSLFLQQKYVLPEGELVGDEVVGSLVGSLVGIFEGKFVGFTVGPEHEM
jgi:hypothetical protein